MNTIILICAIIVVVAFLVLIAGAAIGKSEFVLYGFFSVMVCSVIAFLTYLIGVAIYY